MRHLGSRRSTSTAWSYKPWRKNKEKRWSRKESSTARYSSKAIKSKSLLLPKHSWNLNLKKLRRNFGKKKAYRNQLDRVWRKLLRPDCKQKKPLLLWKRQSSHSDSKCSKKKQSSMRTTRCSFWSVKRRMSAIVCSLRSVFLGFLTWKHKSKRLLRKKQLTVKSLRTTKRHYFLWPLWRIRGNK